MGRGDLLIPVSGIDNTLDQLINRLVRDADELREPGVAAAPEPK
jgi:hypothetical protein